MARRSRAAAVPSCGGMRLVVVDADVPHRADRRAGRLFVCGRSGRCAHPSRHARPSSRGPTPSCAFQRRRAAVPGRSGSAVACGGARSRRSDEALCAVVSRRDPTERSGPTRRRCATHSTCTSLARRRVAEVGLYIRTVRGRGYLMDASDSGQQLAANG